MELWDIEEKEKLGSKSHLRVFRYDLSVLLAASSLVIIVLYLGNGLTLLCELLESPLSRLVSFVNGLDNETSREAYRAFIRSDTFEEILSLIVYAFSLLIPFLFSRAFLKNKPASFYPVKAVLPKEPGKFIFFTFGFTLSMNLVCNLLLSELYPELAEPVPSSVPAILISVITAVIIAPIGEELIFRGVILQTLRPYGTGFAVFVSSLIFGLAHRNPPQVINGFFFGICLAIGFCKTNSVTVCVLLHLVNNAFSVAIGYLLLDKENGLFTLIIGIGIIIVICFAVTSVFDFLSSGRSSILVCDDDYTGFPRIAPAQFASTLVCNFFFWFYLIIVILGTVVLY